MEKIVRAFGIAIILIGTVFITQAMGKEEVQDYEKTLSAIGFIIIDSGNYEIKGFVLSGRNDGELIFFKFIDIDYDGTPIFVTNPHPFIFHIKYNPTD